MDNREANILVGEETPVRVIDYGSGTVAAQSTVQFKQTGIKLVVTPHVTDDRHITMKLHTERSAVRPVADRELGFIVETQQADNQLLVADGQTAVIGGLTVTEVHQDPLGHPDALAPAAPRPALLLLEQPGNAEGPDHPGDPAHPGRQLLGGPPRGTRRASIHHP